MAGSSHAPRPGQEPGWPKPPRLLGVFFYVIGVTVLFGLLSTIATDGQARAVPYTEFKQLVRSGTVASVTISEERTRGTLMSQRQDLKLQGSPIAERRAQGREQRDND